MSYVGYYAAFAALGYSTLLVNYRGSLGFGQTMLEVLPGHVGDMDVHDVNDAASFVLEQYPDSFDPAQIAVFGGSHGGLLAAHLSAQFPGKSCAPKIPKKVLFCLK